MNQLKVFDFKGNEVRTVMINEQPWWVAKDICDVLDIKNATQAVQQLDDDERSMFNIGRQGEANIVNEPGLYSLILGSRKPEAREFKRWITHEVIPSIRKTGSYAVDKPKSSAELLLMYAQQFVDMEKKVDQMQTTVTTIQETFLQEPDEDWRKMINGMMKGASFRRGGDYQELRNQSYAILELRAHCDLSARVRNYKQRLTDGGATKTQIEKANRMDVIEAEPRLKEIYTTIVKELSIGSSLQPV